MGYGRVTYSGKRTYAHRFFFAQLREEIPLGMVIDHQCHNADLTCVGGADCKHRLCVNPNHLALSTHQENLLNSRLTITNRNAEKTHCKHGHELTPDNIQASKVKDNARLCMTCQRQWRLAHREEHAERNRVYGRAYYAKNSATIMANRRARNKNLS